MIKKREFYVLIILMLFLTGLFVFIFLTPSKTFGPNDKAEIHINAKELIAAYLSDENKADMMYTNKLIQISGTLKSIKYLNNRNTLIINRGKNSSGIICDLNDNEINKLQNLRKDQKIEIKGVCKGFLKDVILLNCYIEADE